MPFSFTAEQSLPFAPSLVFTFFANPHNLPLLMPSWQHTRIEQLSLATPPTHPQGISLDESIIAGPGSQITISFRALPLLPFRLSWQARIDTFVWNQSFSDVQLRGPFKSWHHTHSITTGPRSGSILSDEVTYELPLGPFSALANALFVRPQLERVFRYRHQRTLELMAVR